MTGGTALLDVNVLVALAWPNHEAHRAARAWFDEASAAGWATTPVTECGFVRVSANRRIMPVSTTPTHAVDLLSRLRQLPGHEFWPDDVPLVTGDHVATGRISGFRQVTDAHLLALCRSRSGFLLTFDSKLTELAGPDDLMVLQADLQSVVR